MVDGDNYPSGAEQMAFSAVHDLIGDWIKKESFSPKELGSGLLTATIHCYSKSISYEDIATILYKRADELATRGITDEG